MRDTGKNVSVKLVNPFHKCLITGKHPKARKMQQLKKKKKDKKF